MTEDRNHWIKAFSFDQSMGIQGKNVNVGQQAKPILVVEAIEVDNPVPIYSEPVMCQC